MYVSMKNMLSDANANNYAVMAINCFNIETARSVIRAAEEENAPIIINIFQDHLLTHCDSELITPVVKTLASRASVSVALNYDHGQEKKYLIKAIDDGFSSVMIDASRLDFENNIKTANEIFSNENTNTMFIFYSYENSKYIAYSYVVGDREVKKSTLIDREKLNGFLESFANINKAQDRIKALKSIENGMLSSAIIKDASKVDTVYITGSYANLFTVPFAYLEAFKNADVIKIRELKYSSEDIINIGNIDIKIETDSKNNFYNSLESLAVQSAKINSANSKREILASHYIGISTNSKPFDEKDIFLSPATNIDIFRYLRGRNDTKLMFAYSANSSGDYYTIMKYLYGNFDKGIINAYRYIKNNKIDFSPINPSDENALYMASYTLFDYILPGIPKKYRKVIYN